ncbi:unnamed protein product [Rotaria sp. Silwood1]|nr:unnamed protein product [Rotaria sp. Silwood1]CAF1688340.1 unnamed protein product [Rotaria sp. Silwood1]CAF4128231.1 unnamed protein product [Rotaria sp. Silwood1]
MAGKTSWPELVGMPVDDAVAAIQNENPNLDVIKVEKNSVGIMDYRCDRVRVFYDTDGNVSSAPSIG